MSKRRDWCHWELLVRKLVEQSLEKLRGLLVEKEGNDKSIKKMQIFENTYMHEIVI